jgi:hypothetical protein
MSVRRVTASLVAALALAAPASALAQGAGDEQYSDPFGTQQGDSGSGGGSSPSNGGGSGQAPAPAPAPASAPAPSGASAPTSSAPEASGLPRTGADAALVALLGCGLVLTGVGLRLRVRVD